MPRNKSRYAIHSGRSSGRLTEWIGAPFVAAETGLAAATFVLDSSLSTLSLAKRPFTITRTIGTLWVGSDQLAGPEYPFGALGMQVVSDKAVATGATALPDPVTEVSDDRWFMYKAFAAYGGVVQGRGNLHTFDFDSRAQRKVEDGDDIAVMMANSSATDGLEYILNYRILVKLS